MPARRLLIVRCATASIAAGAAVSAPAQAGPVPEGRSPEPPALYQTAHYRIRSELDVDTTRRLGGHMDRMYQEYQRLFAGLTPRDMDLELWIELFATQDAFWSAMRDRHGMDLERARGATLRRGRELVLAAWLGQEPIEELERTLRHEGFHQFEHRFFRGMPRWLSEGLAEVYESAVVLHDGVVLGEVEPAAVAALAAQRRDGGLTSLRDLLAIDAAGWAELVALGQSRKYVEVWSVVHFLLYGDGRRHRPAFDQLLIHMNRGRPWQEAFASAFGAGPDRPPFARRWQEYAMALEPTDLAGTICNLEFLTAGLGALAAIGVHPETLEGLRDELQHRGFHYQTGRFGVRRSITAADEGAFAVPGGAARFVLVEGALRSAGGPRRFAATRGLRPLELRIESEPQSPGRRDGAPRWTLVSGARKAGTSP